MSISNGPLVNNLVKEGTKLELKQNVNQTAFTNKLEDVVSNKQISREEFQQLSKSVAGGEKSLAEFLKTNNVMPEGDVNQLSKLFHFGSNASLIVNIKNSAALEQFLNPSRQLTATLNKPAPKLDAGDLFADGVKNNLSRHLLKDLKEPIKTEVEVKIGVAITSFKENPDKKAAFNNLRSFIETLGLPKENSDFGLASLNRAEGNWKKLNAKGPLVVTNQTELSKDLSSNSITGFMHGLSSIKPETLGDSDQKVLTTIKSALSNAQERANKLQGITLQKGEGLLLNASDIKALLSSKDPEDVKAGMEATKAICDIASHPKLIDSAIKNSAMAPSATAKGVDSTQVHTSFIKWSRSIATISFFQGALPAKLDKAVSEIKDFKLNDEKATDFNIPKGVKMPGDINRYIANVGFNRLMSGNNMLGASKSSDVDFKMVFDDVSFKKDLKTANPKLSPEQIEQISKKAQETFVSVMKEEKKTFEGDFKLTLEVADFTVKPLSRLATEALTDKVEQNFLATVRYNSTLMSGNPEVNEKFLAIIKNNLSFPKDWKATITEGSKLEKPDEKTKNISMKTADLIAGDKTLKKDVIDFIKSDPELTKQATAKGIDLENPDSKKLIQFLSNPAVLNKVVSKDTISVSLESKVNEYNAKATIPNRNWEQNLGESDKGSISVIKILPKMETVVEKAAEKITATPESLKLAIIELKDNLKNGGKDELAILNSGNKPKIEELAAKIKDLLVKEPGLLKTVIHSDALKNKLLADPEIKDALGKVPMFTGEKDDKKLALVFKLTANFTKDDGNRNFIGKDGPMAEGKDWIFSVKFSGCRLNDMFDMVPEHEYVETFTKGKDVEEPVLEGLKKTYNDSKQVAGAINAFSIQVQNRIYEHYSAEPHNKDHDDMDKFYDRVNATEFGDMISKPDMKVKFETMLKGLNSELDKLPEGALREKIEAHVALIKEVLVNVSKPFAEIENPKGQGLILFTAMSKIAELTAEHAKPKSTV